MTPAPRIHRNTALLAAILSALLTAGTLHAQSGVFERPDRPGIDADTPSAADHRLRWLIFHLLYTDERLSCYAPGGAMGARFDLFQFEGFPGSQPRGYAVRIVVRERQVVLLGAVDTEHDRLLAEARVRELPGVRHVDNLIAVDPGARGCRQ